MRHSPVPGRLAAALATTLALAACGGTVDFSVEKDLDIDAAVNAGTTLAPVDLAAEAGGAWKHRDKIDKVTINAAEATITMLLAGNTATEVNGEVWLLPDGATGPGPGAVKVKTLTAEPVQLNQVVALDLSPELNAFVRNAFNGSGKFSLYAAGTGAGGKVVAIRLHVVLGAKLKWKVI